MRRNRNRRRPYTNTSSACLCGALIEGRGARCRKCRRRLRWDQRMNGEQRAQRKRNNRPPTVRLGW
jgi:hypothetical protein